MNDWLAEPPANARAWLDRFDIASMRHALIGTESTAPLHLPMTGKQGLQRREPQPRNRPAVMPHTSLSELALEDMI